MGRTPTQAAHSSVGSNVPPFARHLRAENKTPSTIKTHVKAVEQLADLLDHAGMPTDVPAGKVHAERLEVLTPSADRSGAIWGRTIRRGR